jgi:hypothetical protein
MKGAMQKEPLTSLRRAVGPGANDGSAGGAGGSGQRRAAAGSAFAPGQPAETLRVKMHLIVGSQQCIRNEKNWKNAVFSAF